MPNRECPECGEDMIYDPALMYYICPECGNAMWEDELDEAEEELNSLGDSEINYHNTYDNY